LVIVLFSYNVSLHELPSENKVFFISIIIIISSIIIYHLQIYWYRDIQRYLL